MQKYKISSCENIQAHLSTYFDNEMPLWKRHLIRQHLKRCSTCAEQAASIQQTDKLLHFVEPVKASDAFLSHVMQRVSAAKIYQKPHRSGLHRLGIFVEKLLARLRHNIRAYTPIYTLVLTVAVFTMIGVTFYLPPGEKFEPKTQFDAEMSEAHREKLISFEVIPTQQSKRVLKTR